MEHFKVRDCSGAALMALPTDTPTIRDLDSQDTPWGGLYRSAGLVDEDTTWDQVDAVQLLGGTITIPEGRTLTIAAGAIVKSGQFLSSNDGRWDDGDSWPIVVEGSLNVAGTEDAPVRSAGV